MLKLKVSEQALPASTAAVPVYIPFYVQPRSLNLTRAVLLGAWRARENLRGARRTHSLVAYTQMCWHIDSHILKTERGISWLY